jgi:hypothetical protein
VALLLLGVILPIAAVSSAITGLTNRVRAEERRRALEEQDNLIKRYSVVHSGISDALSDNNVARAKEIISKNRDFLFAGTVQAQEMVARIDAEPEAAAPTPSVASSEARPAKVEFPQRVYIHFAGTYTRAQITELNAALRKAGWDMQSSSGQRIDKARNRNEVRFGPGGEKAAEELVKAINSSSVRPGQPLKPAYMQIIGPRNLEVWISN